MEINFKKFMDLSKRQGKVLICGEEGAGKTLLSTYVGIQKMLRGQEDAWKSYNEIDKFNNMGYHFTKNFEHLVFSNYDINCSGTKIPLQKSYILDPFKVGLKCEDYETNLYPPFSFMIITECQRVFNALMWQYIRPEIRAFWETSRQADVELIADTNQPNLIYNGIRNIFNRVIYLYKPTEPIKRGNKVVGHKMFVKEFKTYQLYEKYMESNNDKLILKTYTLKLDKCCYENFDTKQCKWLHLKGRLEQDYLTEHFNDIQSVEDVEHFVQNFGLSPPEGYYTTKNSKKCEENDMKDFNNDDFEMQEDNDVYDVDTMLKLKHMGKLIKDVLGLYCDISQRNDVCNTLGYKAKKTKKRAVAEVYKVFCNGVKAINQKIPEFVELPTLKKETDSSYSETNSKGDKIVNVSTLEHDFQQLQGEQRMLTEERNKGDSEIIG